MANSGTINTSPSGLTIEGENEGDTLLWKADRRVWEAGPGGGGGGNVDSVFGRDGAVVAESGDYGSTQITNDSEAERWEECANLTEVLDLLALSLTTTGIVNLTIIPGATLTAALDAFFSDWVNQNSNQVANVSTVPGATVTEALDALQDSVGDISSDGVANDSGVPGATVTAALDALAPLLSGRTLLGVASRLTAGAQTIACPAGTRGVLARQVGAGAGGGGALQTAAPSQTNSGGGGGGAGAEQEYFYTAASDIASIDVVCGTAGSGQPTTGGNGTATTVTINGETFTSNPGEGGSQGVVTGAPVSAGARGGLPGQFNFQTGTNFTLLRSNGGQPGENGTGPNGTLLLWYGGMGGSSTWGGGGRGGFSGNGEAGTGNGSGGGGGSSSAGVARNGANGTPGGVMFYFFSAPAA